VNSSATRSLRSEHADLDTLSAPTRAYFRARLKNRLYDLVLTKFAAQSGLTRAILARRMGKKPEVVSRLLGAPGNWTLDTVSDLLLAIAGEELDATSTNPQSRPPRNYDSYDQDPPPPTDWNPNPGRNPMTDANPRKLELHALS
jgi:hypothetical protein